VGKLTTHVLDTAAGRPAAGMRIDFAAVGPKGPTPVATVHTNAEGRTDRPLLDGDAMRAGEYELTFHVADYFRGLGLDLPPEADTEPHVEAVLPGGFKIAFDAASTITQFNPAWTPPVGGPSGALAFRCDTPAEVDEVYKSLVDAGYQGHLEPWDALWGQRYASLHDPDGNGVDIYAPLAT
jgi:5-hydroxyisourate hydrolase-like protein (transthyretin family)